MSKFHFENSDSKSSQSNFSENMISLSPKSQERLPESQKPLSINETPLSAKGNVKSYCRIRPNNTYNSSLNKFKIENNSKTLIADYTAESDRNNPSKQFIYKYNFTEVYWSHTSNQEIYEKVCKPNIEELFSSHKSSLIFVYGITNSGKTYTVSGNEEFPGILQLSLIELFKKFEKLKENNNLWHLTCTYIEIYNEEAFDLLSNDRKKIKVGGTTNRFYPVGNIVKSIEKISDFTFCLKIGEANRTKAETNANANSSRSHSIFRVELSYEDDNHSIDPVSFSIVDLAGAERVSRSGVLGNGVLETGNINSSLLVLKKCFSAMEANSRINNIENKLIVPVRESKLTMLFKEYFAPHQNISVICTINPDKNDMMDIRSVLNFGAKAMKVKPMKSWIPINNYNSREVSPNKSRSKGNNSSIKDKKRYRMYTEKKYLLYNPKNNFSKEKTSKNREDYYSNDHSNNKKKNNFISLDKPQNIKIIKNKKNDYNHIITNNIRHIDLNNENSNNNGQIYSSNNDENSNNNSQIHLSRNGEQSNNNSSFNIITNSDYEQRIKCSTNPFELVIDNNNFFVKNGPSKEKLRFEKEMKEKKQKEMSKKGDEIKKMLLDLLIKKKYYNNYERNIEIYENQCNNIDLTEAEILLSKNSNIFSLKNPFIKNYKEDKHILSKSHQINLTYENVIKEKILKNENNINISYKGTRANNNLENFISYNQEIPNNDFDIIRANKEFMEELQIKLNNSNNEIEQKMIQDFLDRSFQQYEKSQFKAHFGIGESLIKKVPEQQDKKEENKFVQKFDIMNNDIEMADNLNNKSKDNDYNIDDLFDNSFNYKSKKGNNIIKEEIRKIANKMDDNKENKDENIINKNNEDGSEEISDIENKKKKKKNDRNDVKEKQRKKQKKSKKNKKSKKQKEKREEEEKEEKTDEEREEKTDEEKEEKIDNEKDGGEYTVEDKDKEIEDQSENRTKKYPKSKSKKRNEKRYRNKSHDSNSNDDDTSEEKSESTILSVKNNKKKKKKNKKRKIESDEDDIDGDNSFNEENANIKPIKSKKNKSKKLK